MLKSHTVGRVAYTDFHDHQAKITVIAENHGTRPKSRWIRDYLI